MTRLWVAIPDSAVSDASALREKTVKVGIIGRALAIFRVERVYLYTDEHGLHRRDGLLIRHLLEYMETPQYLRKRLFPRSKLLQFAGLLPPLRTPHHKLEVPPERIRIGEYREGVTVKKEGNTFVDVGLAQLVPVELEIEPDRRLTVVFTQQFPHLKCRPVKKEETGEYWGYEVVTAPSVLHLIRSAKPELLLLTSRYGKQFASIWPEFLNQVQKVETIMLVFGSPKRGLFEILREENSDPHALSEYAVNTIPKQGTATVRTEEALVSTLSIVNISLEIH